MKRAFVVVDLGFGDCGKGLLTDFLVRQHEARLVVRYNGGAQAGHNVVTSDGRHHTFAQFGAGSFVPGVRTFLSKHVVVHPTAMLLEAQALELKGVSGALQRVFLSESARVITPFHQAANRLRELARGTERHGSCGVGVGETVADSIAHPEETICAADLRSESLATKLRLIRDRKRAELKELALVSNREWQLFEDDQVIHAWIDRVSALRDRIVADGWLDAREDETVVFEGAQGVLLDERFGFHPHTTWSNCTADLAKELAGARELETIGVLRSHAVRHGAGPFPSEVPDLAFREHNAGNDWQGRVRYGLFDAVLARYSLKAVGGVDRLAITHLDQSPGRYVSSYRHGSERLSMLELPRSIEAQEQLGKLLCAVTPFVEARPDPVQAIESLLDRRIDFTSAGPTANDVIQLSSSRPPPRAS